MSDLSFGEESITPGAVVLTVKGAIKADSTAQVAEFEKLIEKISDEGNNHILVDLSNVESISTPDDGCGDMFVALLVKAHAEVVKVENGKFILVFDSSQTEAGTIASALDFHEVKSLFTICESKEQGLEQLAS